MKKLERQIQESTFPSSVKPGVSLLAYWLATRVTTQLWQSKEDAESSRQQAWLKRVWKIELATATASQGPENRSRSTAQPPAQPPDQGLAQDCPGSTQAKAAPAQGRRVNWNWGKNFLCPSLPPPCSRRLPVGSPSASQLLPNDLATCLVKAAARRRTKPVWDAITFRPRVKSLPRNPPAV